MAEVKTIDSTRLKELLESDEVRLVDVREENEFKSEHIEGAELLPLSKLNCDDLKGEGKQVVFQCLSGMRSEQACQKIIKDLDIDVCYLVGGIEAWKQEGLEVKQSGKKVMPMQRQVMICAGFIVLTGVILGQFYNELFYGLSAFVGAGLMFAGITGFVEWLKY